MVPRPFQWRKAFISSILSSALIVAQEIETFVSRPDIRAFRLRTTLHDPSRVSKGFLFMSFYNEVHDSPFGMLVQSALNGPHIYDNSGNLIWSGASLFPRRKTYDFKVAMYHDIPRLSFLVDRAPPHLDESPSFDPISSRFPNSGGAILSDDYQMILSVDTQPRSPLWHNIHEFKLVNDGRSVLVVVGGADNFSIPDASKSGLVTYDGFMELEVATGNVLFQWSSKGLIEVNETYLETPKNWGQPRMHWDYVHLNSVEKDAAGDYVISARYTSTIYKISGRDGSILWRLGGKLSSFKLEDFNFTSQHDARVLDVNSTTTILSLFNNAASEIGRSANTSSGIIIALYTEPTAMFARLLQQWNRPDGGLTTARGNLQSLENGNAFTCWSEQAYVSEHTQDGDCVLEARLAVPDVASYRAYKFNYTGRPTERPALRSLLYAHSSSTIAVHHVSWNGATEVASWRFSGGKSRDTASQYALGSVGKGGFETVFVSNGPLAFVQAAAFDVDGNFLGASAIQEVETVVGLEGNDPYPQAWITGLSILTLAVISSLAVIWLLVGKIRVLRRKTSYTLVKSEDEAYESQ